MKKIIIIFTFVFLLALVACSPNEPSGYIDVSWQDKSDTNASKMSVSESIETSKKNFYSKMKTGKFFNSTKVEAYYYDEEGVLVPEAEFDFILDHPENIVKEKNSDSIKIQFIEPGEGKMIVKHKDIKAEYDFFVFRTVGVGKYEEHGPLEKGFNFDEELESTENDIVYDEEKNKIYINQEFAKVPYNGYRKNLVEFDDFEDLVFNEPGYYVEGIDGFSNIFIIKTSNGYVKFTLAAVQKTINEGLWEIIYDFHEAE